jgi:hypothetical protein
MILQVITRPYTFQNVNANVKNFETDHILKRKAWLIPLQNLELVDK